MICPYCYEEMDYVGITDGGGPYNLPMTELLTARQNTTPPVRDVGDDLRALVEREGMLE